MKSLYIAGCPMAGLFASVLLLFLSAAIIRPGWKRDVDVVKKRERYADIHFPHIKWEHIMLSGGGTLNSVCSGMLKEGQRIPILRKGGRARYDVFRGLFWKICGAAY